MVEVVVEGMMGYSPVVPILICPRLSVLEFSNSLIASGVLRSRPTCHGIRRTVIDIARESLVFHFFCIILRLDPCRTGLFLITDLTPTSSRLIGLMTRTPSHALPHGQSRSFVIFILFPLDVIMTY